MKNNKIALLKLDHHGSRLYISENSGKGQAEFAPQHDNHKANWSLYSEKKNNWKGRNSPEDVHFFKELIKDIRDFNGVILAGHGTGHSNEAQIFEKYMVAHHKDLKNLIIGYIKTDNHESEGKLFAKANAELEKTI